MRLKPVHFVLVLGAVVVLALMPLPSPGRVGRAVLDLGHLPLGGILALVLYVLAMRVLPARPWAAALVALVGCAVLLAALEVVQPAFGRERSRADLVVGVLGAAGALAFACARGRSLVPKLVLASLGLVLLAVGALPTARIVADAWRQKRAMPMLASFEDDLELSRWLFAADVIERDGRHATHGLWSLRLVLPPARYPGATLAAPYADWSAYRTLAFDVFLEGEEPLPVYVKIFDADHRHASWDRFEREIELVPGAQTVRIDLDDVLMGPRDRMMNLSEIRVFHVFAHELKTHRTLYVDGVRLSP